MKPRIRHLFLALTLLAALLPVHEAQRRGRTPRLSAQLSTGVARPGQAVNLSVVVEDADQARILGVPAVEGLQLSAPRGPSRRSFTQIVNGSSIVDSKQLTWSIEVRASQPGTFELPPIEVDVQGVVMRTEPLPFKVVRDLRGEDLGSFTITPSSTKVVEGQPFTVELRFGWDVSSNINYANLSLPWWGALPGALELEARELPPGVKQIEGVTVNDRVRVVVEDAGEEDGRRVMYLRRSYLPARSGSIEFPTSFLEFGRLEERRRGIFSTGQQKTASYYVGADPFVLEVVPLPTEGQPFDYSGAVGEIEARASADSRDVTVGDSIKLTVDWTGNGNLEFFEPPDLARIAGFESFKVFGTTEEKSFERRRVVYDLAPLDEGVRELPSVPLSVFDPEQGAYTRVVTDPIPIRVRPLEGRVNLAAETTEHFERDIRDIDARPLAERVEGSEDRLDDRWVFAGLIGVPVAWLLLRVLARRRGDPAAPLERRRRRARRDLARSLRGDVDSRVALESFTAFLAARAREPVEAWIGRDPRSLGDEEPVLDEAAELCARLEHAVFGRGGAVGTEEVLSMADRIVGAGL